MANAGTVTVDFAAETAKFTAELKKVNSSLKNLEGGFNSAKNIANGFLAVFGVGSLVAFAKSSFAAADALSDAADRAGVAVDEFSKLKYAAQQSDVELGAFTTGIQRFQIAMSKAGDQSKEAGVLLAKFGLHAKDLQGLTLSQQLGEVAEAFTQITSPADRTRLAVELFGKSAGPQLVPLLIQGREGIVALTAAADRLGITMSVETAKGIGEADKALKQLYATAGAFTANFFGEAILGFQYVVAAIKGPTGEVQILQAELNRLLDERAKKLKIVRDLEATASTGLFDDVRATTIRRLNWELDGLPARIDVVSQKLQAIGQRDVAKVLAQAEMARAGAETDLLIQEIDLEPIRAMKRVVDELAEAYAQLTISIAENRARDMLDIGQGAAAVAVENEKIISASVAAELDARAAYATYVREKAVTDEASAAEAITATRNAAADAGIRALQSFAGGSKKVAIALVLIQKARAMSEAFVLGQVAIAQAAASLPPPYNLAPIAWAKAFTIANLAAIAASTYGEISSINSAGGAPIGSPSNPINTQSTNTAANDNAAVQDSALQVHIHGNFFGNRETVDYLMTQFRDQINERDVVLFSSDSRQAQELGAD